MSQPYVALNSTVINTIVEGTTLVRSVLREDGSILVQELTSDNKWTQRSRRNPIWGNLRHWRKVRELKNS